MYRFAINRPITTLMGFMAFIVFGLMSYKSMPISLFPNIDFPVVSIQTAYYGADAATVETKVSEKIEEVVSGIDGIKKLTSTSYDNFSSVVIQFELSKNLDAATNDVRDKLGSLQLPREVEKPVVKKLGMGGDVISLFVSTKNRDLQSLMRLVNEKLRPKLQRIKGVGEIEILGYQNREIRVFIDPDKLNKYAITSYELQSIIAAQNISLGAGKIIDTKHEITIKIHADANSTESLQNIEIKPGVRLSDIATVKDGLSDPKSFSLLNNKQGVTLVVKKISGENTLDIIEGVKKTMPFLKELAGEQYVLQLIEDKSDQILVNIDNVTFDLIFGSLLAILIVFAFLRNLTATLVSAVAIPTSIIGTFAIIDYLGYDLNRLTMIGLTLAIGIFIDDAIVVIENISKKLEEGMESFKASIEGISEVAFSILAISSVLLAVFVPVAFMDGIVGLFFNSFAMTVASGIILSFLVAVMLIPTLGARTLNSKQNWLFRFTEPAFVLLDKIYVAILKIILRFKLITVIAAIGLLVLSALTLKVGMDFMPMEDNSEYRVMIKAPVGTSLEQMKKYTAPLLKQIRSDELTEYTILSIGYNAANEPHKAKIYVRIVTKENRIGISQEDVTKKYRGKFENIENLNISVENLPPFETGQSNSPVQVVITGSSLDKLGEISKELMIQMKDIKGLVDIDRDYEQGKPEISISILRENAQRVGVSAQAITAVIASAYSSDSAISYYEEDGREFDITMRIDDKYRNTIEHIKELEVRSSNTELVLLDGLIEIKETSKLSSISRHDRERKVLVTARLDEVSLDTATKEIESIIESILPSGYNFHFSGDIEQMKETADAFAAAVALAIILIYLILAALYESFVQPIIIMVSMPLSFTGVLLVLDLTGNNFSLFVLIGIIMLLGMVGKNAILVVDYANRAIKDGLQIDKALLQAGEKRLRPILMTTFAMIGAMAPLAFGTGPGSEGNAPMALAIIGGLASSTILSLLVVPAIYKLLYPIDTWLRKWYERGEV
ncbi:MAG: efflux RND transporter permease subunit [Sulfurovum sp.]|nr:efflux RND transporter permease subunit [Sulfurovum sp.]